MSHQEKAIMNLSKKYQKPNIKVKTICSEMSLLSGSGTLDKNNSSFSLNDIIEDTNGEQTSWAKKYNTWEEE